MLYSLLRSNYYFYIDLLHFNASLILYCLVYSCGREDNPKGRGAVIKIAERISSSSTGHLCKLLSILMHKFCVWICLLVMHLLKLQLGRATTGLLDSQWIIWFVVQFKQLSYFLQTSLFLSVFYCLIFTLRFKLSHDFNDVWCLWCLYWTSLEYVVSCVDKFYFITETSHFYYISAPTILMFLYHFFL